MSPKASPAKAQAPPRRKAPLAKAPAAAGRLARNRWLPPLLMLWAGAMAGLATPGSPAPWLWVVVLVPFFVGLDLLPRPVFSSGFWLRAFALCWVAGVGMAWGNGDWIVNTAFLYGHLPLALAWGVNLFGYGSLFGVELFGFLGIPFLLGLRRPAWGFLLVLLWSAAFQGLTPRFFSWTFGHLIYPQPLLIQVADLVGSAGLNFWILPLHLLLFAALRPLYGTPLFSGRVLAGAAAGVALMFAGAAGYGMWREGELARAEATGQPVNLAGVQPNFSLANLASNPALALSDRRISLDGLMGDTARVLEQVETAEGVPTVVVWPESVFPVPYFRAPRVRQAVEWWTRMRNIHLVLASIADSEPVGAGGGRRAVYGAAIHIAPDGSPPRVYRKISLIPFGETIPLGEVFPVYRELLKHWIPQIAQFEPGGVFTVFAVSPGVRLAPMICFDAIREQVARGMTRNGANLGLVLANLAWFGKTNVSGLMEYAARFRAVENRIPILLLSQNGRSVVLNAAGRRITPPTAEFQPALLSVRVRVPETYSFFSTHANAVHGVYLGGVLLLLAWRCAGGLMAWRAGRKRGG